MDICVFAVGMREGALTILTDCCWFANNIIKERTTTQPTKPTQICSCLSLSILTSMRDLLRFKQHAVRKLSRCLPTSLPLQHY